MFEDVSELDNVWLKGFCNATPKEPGIDSNLRAACFRDASGKGAVHRRMAFGPNADGTVNQDYRGYNDWPTLTNPTSK